MCSVLLYFEKMVLFSYTTERTSKQISEETIKGRCCSNHNSNKQSTKRRSSILREESRAKRIFCKEAVSHHEAVYNFEFKYNTKGIQTEVTFEY